MVTSKDMNIAATYARKLHRAVLENKNEYPLSSMTNYAYNTLIEAFIEVFKTNPRFDQGKFRKECRSEGRED